MHAALRVLLLLAMTAPAHAVMYKWTDDAGNVHYSQVPPPDKQSQSIAPPPKVTPPPRPEKNTKDAGDVDKESAEYHRQALFRKNCEAARNNLSIYERSNRITVNGETIALEPEERARRIEEAKQHIKTYCD